MSTGNDTAGCSSGNLGGHTICLLDVVISKGGDKPRCVVGELDPDTEVVSMAVAAELLCRSRAWLKRTANRETLNLVDGPRPSYVKDHRVGFLTADSVAAALRSEAKSREVIMHAPSTFRTVVDQKQSPGV